MLWILSAHDFDLKTQDKMVICVRVRLAGPLMSVPMTVSRRRFKHALNDRVVIDVFT